MKEKDVIDLIELLYPYFKDKIKEEDKNAARLVNATVVDIGGPGAEIRINPYDTNTIYATTSIDVTQLHKGDSVKVLYSDSLKNAQIIALNGENKGGHVTNG